MFTNKTMTYYIIFVMSSCSFFFACSVYELIMLLDYVQKVNICYVITMLFQKKNIAALHFTVTASQVRNVLIT